MRLLVLINAFNEARTIGKAIESVHDVADEIHLFDGAYADYPHEKPYSTDQTLAIARGYPKVRLHETNKAYTDQCEKRTAMFVGHDGDYYLKLDGDEYVTNPEIIRDHLTGIDVGWVWTLSNLYQTPIMTARIFKHREGLHYAGRHHWLYDGERNFITSDQQMNPRFKHMDTPIRIFNFRESSTPERIAQKKQFLIDRSKQEVQYKREDQVYDKFTRLVPHHNRAPDSPKVVFKTLKYFANPVYSMTLMVSRSWSVSRYFKHLERMEVPKQTELLVVIDTDNSQLEREVFSYLRDQVYRFAGVKYTVTGHRRLPEFSQVALRRQRIINNWHLLLTELRGEIVLGAEDDSLPDPDAYIRLLKTLRDTGAHFVQGSIISRWNVNLIPCWKVQEDEQGNAIKVYSERENDTGLEPIQGVGWYCFVAYADVMRKYPMQLDKLLPLGPDVRFGYQLHKGGFKLLHQWDVKVRHITERKDLVLGKDKTITRQWVREGDKWSLED